MNTVLELIYKSFFLNKSEIAVRIYDNSWSYGELHHMSNRIASFLLEKGIQKGDRVAVLMNKSIYLYAAIIGIMRSGGVYVPFETKAPSFRLAEMLEDISPFYVFVDRLTANNCRKIEQLLQKTLTTVFLDDTESQDYEKIDFEEISVRALVDSPSIHPEDLAYILFTSGSTGKPKGVMITHGNLYFYVNWSLSCFHFGPGEVVSGLHATAFDVSVSDIFLTFCSGATLAVYPEEVIFPKDILRLSCDYGVTKLHLISSSLNSLVKSYLIRPEFMGNLKDVFFGSEMLPINTLIELMNMFPHTKFHNCYGPTETTIWISVHTFHKKPNPEKRILPVGFPLPGHRFVLDTTDFTKDKNKGELIIFGPQVGAGYWNDPEKTDKAFGVNEQGERFYRTGDIASHDPEQGYFVHGRKDSQIKIRGYRIELGEIEHAVSMLPFINENVVIPVYVDGDVKELKLIYTSEQECEKEILKNLRKNLPKYMIPKHFVYLEKLPKNKNNKVDRVLIMEKYGDFV